MKQTLRHARQAPRQDFAFLTSCSILFIFATFSCATTAGDQTFRISESSISRQIHQPTINAIFKDSLGNLWIGTQQGLYKHDGSKLHLFNSEESNDNWIPVSDISGITENSSGQIVVATFGAGVLKWNDNIGTFERAFLDSGEGVSNLTGVVSDEADKIWVATREGIFLHKDRGSSYENLQKQDLIDSDTSKVTAIANGSRGIIFFSDGTAVYKLSSRDLSAVEIIWDSRDHRFSSDVSALTADYQEHKLYVGTQDGNILIIDLKDTSVSQIKRVDQKSSTSIYQLKIYANYLWVATNNGLYYSDLSFSSFRVFRHNNSKLSNDHVTTLHQDEGLLWVGTYQGLNILKLVPFRTFDEENSNIFNDTLAFAEDSYGRLWIGTYNGLYIFNKEEGLHTNLNDSNFFSSLRDQRVMTIDSKDLDIWLGLRNKGVQILNIKTGKVTTPDIPQADDLEVTKILHTRDDSTWLATYNRGVFSLIGDAVTSYLDEGLLPEASITILFELESGTLLASSEKNIYRYDKVRNRFDILEFNFSDSNQPPLILSLSQSKTGDIWLGTKDQGLFIWPIEHQKANNHDLLSVYTDSEMPSFTIYAIQFDRQGNAWCSTQQGIIKLDANGKLIARFTSTDGLQGDDFNFGASFIDSQGRMYFGGSHGYSRFTPEEVDVQTAAPRLLLNNVEISRDGDIFSYVATELEALELSHQDQHVRFEFGVLDFLDPEKNLYRYKVEGMDRDWIDSGTRNFANYSDFPPGDYVLRVQGANSAGVWNRTGLSLNIHVAPPPWKTWWAHCFYWVFAAFLLWLAKRTYDSYEIEKRAAKMAVEMHEAAEMADDEIQEQLEIRDDFVKSVYRHNVDTLTLINDFISAQSATFTDFTTRKIVGAMSKRVEALALLEDCIYHQNELLLADLHKFTDILIARLLRASPIREETITSINEVSSQLLPIELASPLAIALNELLENSIQHAFRSESSANYLHVVFTCEQLEERDKTRYRLTVEDNGQGFPSYIDAQAGGTTGLAIIHAMAERLSGSLDINSEKGVSATLTFIRSEGG